MGSHRKPGPTGTHGQSADLNDGTLIRSSSPRPGPLRPGEPGTRSWLGAQVSAARTASPGTGGSADEARVIDALRFRLTSVLPDGGRYRLVRLEDWAALGHNERFQRVGRDAAVKLLTIESRRPELSAAERSAFETAARLLVSDDVGDLDSGLLLLRLVQVRTRTQGTEGAAATPSQLAAAHAGDVVSDAAVEEHWVGLNLKWEDGIAIGGAAYIVIAPDGRRFTGVTDGQGWALVVGLKTAGQCRISFPGFDRSSLTTS